MRVARTHAASRRYNEQRFSAPSGCVFIVDRVRSFAGTLAWMGRLWTHSFVAAGP